MNDVLQDLLAVWEPDEIEYGEERLRLSASGNKPRRLAFDLHGYPKVPLQSRTVINFAVGDLVHDYIRDELEKTVRWEVLDRELTVESIVFDESGEPVTTVEGHVDLRLRDTETDTIYLVDIKTVSHVGYIYNDPKNKKKNRYWKARNYTFSANNVYGGDVFGEKYLYQLASYADSEPVEDIEHNFEFDEAFFFTIDKATGHVAIGHFDLSEDVLIELLDERDENFIEAMDAESPYDLEVCYDVEEGKQIPLGCGYCDFNKHCLDLTGTPPKWKVKAIRTEPSSATLDLLEQRKDQ